MNGLPVSRFAGLRVSKYNLAYIGIGSNLNDRYANIDKAIKLLDLTNGIILKRKSSIYETEPVGGPPQEKYLNGVLEIETKLSPFKLLSELQKIERHLGRKRRVKNGPRTIDLDILLYGNKKIDAKNLKIPHPRMHKREFVLKGLRELIPHASAWGMHGRTKDTTHGSVWRCECK